MSILIGVLIPTVSIYAVEKASLSALQFQAIPLTMIMTGAISVFAGAIYASAAENPRVLAAYSTVENLIWHMHPQRRQPLALPLLHTPS